MFNKSFLLNLTAAILLGQTVWAGQPRTYRLYDAATFFFNNPEGIAFELKLDVRDINHRGCGPGEMLVKVYPPDGKLLVRAVMPDDGVESKTYGPVVAAWDHEAWYYSSCYTRGLDPATRWSALSDPARIDRIRPQELRYTIPGGQKGLYRVVLAGTPDLFVTVGTEPELNYGVAGGPDWLHGRADQYGKMYVYVPRGALNIELRILENDRPFGRTATVSDAAGNALVQVDNGNGFDSVSLKAEPDGAFDDRILTLEVGDSPGDYLLDLNMGWPRGARYGRRGGRIAAILCRDEATARAIQGGAIYHDGDVFWHRYQVAMHDWLKTLAPADFEYPADLPANPVAFIRQGSHETTRDDTADRLMHDYVFNKNPKLLNAALRDMQEGMRRIGFMDHINRPANLAYEMGTYSYFYHRPAWRILQHSDAPAEVKDAVRQFAIQIGDRLAFARGMALVNGNALASLTQGLRYCVEATGDPLQTRLFEDYWHRFTTGGFHDRIGIGPSGGVQESFGYDHHYGSYVLRGWQAIVADLDEPRFKQALHNLYTLYSYTMNQEANLGPWSSRTHQAPTGVNFEQPVRWKGFPGPDLTESVRQANEWFVARRPTYYAVTYHGRLTPSWMGDGFHGQIGYGGGMLCQVHVPGHGAIFAGRVNASYGKGMHLSQWRNFRLHSLVGTMADGQPLVAANSEHLNARLEGHTVRSSGEVRQATVRAYRAYTFNDAEIECSVSLAPAAGDKVLRLWGGLSELRGHVTEAYEMLPYIEGGTTLMALDADGRPIGELREDQPIEAAGLAVQRQGFGATLRFDRARPVMLGMNKTILIQLANSLTVADEVAFNYTIRPYIGSEPPRPGQ